jgi:hypothetical protein
MEAVRETTVWADGSACNHTYLLSGDRMLAYIPRGSAVAQYFKAPITISRSGRKFERLLVNPFTVVEPEVTTLKQVAGSNGSVYHVDTAAGTCTCPGYTFRGQCKHTKELHA